MVHRSEDTRNIALIGHTNSGKTAFIDALAYSTGASTRHGNSLEGSSVSDTQPEEKERKHTLSSHLFGFHHDECWLNILDTPGHPDFVADAISAMQVVECGLLCVSASQGPTVHARHLFEEARLAGIGRAIVLTHPDSDNASFEDVLAQLLEMCESVVPVTYPDGNGSDFTAMHDVLSGDGPRAAEFREKLEERVALADDEILESYLETGELSEANLLEYLPQAIAKHTITPLFVVSSPKEVGLRKLVNFVHSYFPSPISFGGRAAIAGDSGDGDGEPQILSPDPDGPFVGVVFKIVNDPYVGRQSYVRCLRGSLRADQGFCNVRTGDHDKVSGLTVVDGVDVKIVDEVVAGDLFYVSKLEDLGLGDTVTADDARVRIPSVVYPDPVYALAVTPSRRGDEQKFSQGLEKLASEDPTFQTSRDPQTGEHLVSGSSPIHLEIQLGRLFSRYGVSAETRTPTIPYRETITVPAEGHHKHRKQSGGRGQFAEVYLRAKPQARGEGYAFLDNVVGGAVPRNFIPEVDKGVQRFLLKGPLTGSPVVDVAAELYDGKYHDVDSDQLSFQLAGERAFAEAFARAKPILLEPIMDVTIKVPERFTGDVTSNLATLRGRMSGMEIAAGIQVVTAQVPLKEMQDYATQLRSMTAGEGHFTMQGSHYEPVPTNVQRDLLASHARELAET